MDAVLPSKFWKAFCTLELRLPMWHIVFSIVRSSLQRLSGTVIGSMGAADAILLAQKMLKALRMRKNGRFMRQ
jgi:hypothetical protein